VEFVQKVHSRTCEAPPLKHQVAIGSPLPSTRTTISFNPALYGSIFFIKDNTLKPDETSEVKHLIFRVDNRVMSLIERIRITACLSSTFVCWLALWNRRSTPCRISWAARTSSNPYVWLTVHYTRRNYNCELSSAYDFGCRIMRIHPKASSTPAGGSYGKCKLKNDRIQLK